MSDDSNKDPLLGNKIAGAVLAALLVVFGLPQLTAAIFGGEHHGGSHGEELHLAYCCVELETSAGGGEEAAPVDLGTLLAGASAAAGERRAALCKSCHTFEKGGANSTGPNLWGVVGRAVAGHEGFSYTGALQGLGGTWTYERLDQFLRNSQEYAPGTAMVQRFARDDQRADILAFLQTLSDDPVPFPAPAITPAPVDGAAAEGEGADGGEGVEAAEAVSDGEDADETPADDAENGAEDEEASADAAEAEYADGEEENADAPQE